MNQSSKPSDYYGLETDLAFIAKEIKPLVSELQNKKILITGATGFFGKWLLLSLIYLNETEKLGVEIFALSRNPEKFLTKYKTHFESVSFIKGDISSFEFNKDLDFVIHAATDANIANHRSNPLESFSTIVDGTRNVLSMAKTCGVSRFLNISSGAVYGKQRSDVTHIPENYQIDYDFLSPSNSYAVGKRAAEFLVNAFGEVNNIHVSHARCFAFAGAFLPTDASFAIGNFVGDKLAGRDIKLTGDGSPLRSYMYAADLVIWLLTILFKGKEQEAYNVGSDYAVSIKAISQAVEAVFADQKIELEKSYESDNQYIPSIEKAKRELGLEVNYKFETTVRNYIEWSFNKGQGTL